MEFANKAVAAWNQVFRSLTPAARLAAVAALAAVVCGAALFCRPDGASPDAYLMGGRPFSAAQLRDMEAAFGKARLADYEFTGDRVRVPRGEQSKYMAALADAGALPDDFGEHLRRAVNSTGFLLSGSRQEAQAKIALESELQLVVSSMPGVKNAFVHIAEETSGGFPKRKTVTASVAIVPRGEGTVDHATLAAIREFIASAWAGLKPDAVTVVSTTSSPSAAAAAEPPPADRAQRDHLLGWLSQNWRTLGIGGVVLVGFVVLRSTIRSAARPLAVPAPVISSPPPELLGDYDDSAPPAVHEVLPHRLDGLSHTLRSELQVMVRDHPQTAAGVLRNWLGSAS